MIFSFVRLFPADVDLPDAGRVRLVDVELEPQVVVVIDVLHLLDAGVDVAALAVPGVRRADGLLGHGRLVGVAHADVGQLVERLHRELGHTRPLDPGDRVEPALLHSDRQRDPLAALVVVGVVAGGHRVYETGLAVARRYQRQVVLRECSRSKNASVRHQRSSFVSITFLSSEASSDSFPEKRISLTTTLVCSRSRTRRRSCCRRCPRCVA